MAMEVGLSESLKFYHYVDNKGYRILNSVEDLVLIINFIPESREVKMCIVIKETEEAKELKVLGSYTLIGTYEGDNNEDNIDKTDIDVADNDGIDIDVGM